MSIYVWRLAEDTLNVTWNFLYSNHQVHRDFLITLYQTVQSPLSRIVYDNLKMAITEYTRNVDRAILNMVFKNTVQCVNKCLETGGGHFEHYL